MVHVTQPDTPSPPLMALRAKFFRGLADPSRLSILETLRSGPLNVGEIVSGTGLSQPNVSNHLACLLDCGLVRREQQGRFAHYSIADERVANVLGLADEALADVAVEMLACIRYTGRGTTE